MALVDFTLSEDGVSAFNDALVCIHKFSDDVSLEIKKDKVSASVRHPREGFPRARILSTYVLTEVKFSTEQLVLTALNLTKSAYVSFTFIANRFFSRFNFEGNAQYRERFFCSIYIKACTHSLALPS